MPRSKKKSLLRNFFRWCLKQLARIIVVLILLTFIQVLSFKLINPPFTIRYANSWFLKTFTGRSGKIPSSEWRSLEQISPFLRKSVLAAEDQRFLIHNGFDFIEMNEAIEGLLFEKKKRGASTISMQVARTVFLWHSRSIWRKIAEAYYTMLIELLWSKHRILEVYLNTVDWGSGIMGAEAASKKYFQTSSYDLTPSQAALLASILPSPHRWSPLHPSEYIKERQKWILKESKKMPLVGRRAYSTSH